MPAEQLAQLALLMASKDDIGGDAREGLTVEVWKYRGGVTVKRAGHTVLHMTRKAMADHAEYVGLVERTAPVVNVALPRSALVTVMGALMHYDAMMRKVRLIAPMRGEVALFTDEECAAIEAAIQAVQKVQR